MSKRTPTIPAEFEARFLEHLDGRSRVARIIRERLGAVADDQGGEDQMSYAKRSLLRRAIWLELVVERRETEAAEGLEIDMAAQTQMLNTLMGLWKSIGLERKAKPLETLLSLAERKGAKQ